MFRGAIHGRFLGDIGAAGALPDASGAAPQRPLLARSPRVIPVPSADGRPPVTRSAEQVRVATRPGRRTLRRIARKGEWPGDSHHDGSGEDLPDAERVDHEAFAETGRRDARGMTDPNIELSPQSPRFRKAYQSILNEIRAVPANQLAVITVYIPASVTTVLGVLPKLRPLRAQFAQELPNFAYIRCEQGDADTIATSRYVRRPSSKKKLGATPKQIRRNHPRVSTQTS